MRSAAEFVINNGSFARTQIKLAYTHLVIKLVTGYPRAVAQCRKTGTREELQMLVKITHVYLQCWSVLVVVSLVL